MGWPASRQLEDRRENVRKSILRNASGVLRGKFWQEGFYVRRRSSIE